VKLQIKTDMTPPLAAAAQKQYNAQLAPCGCTVISVACTAAIGAAALLMLAHLDAPDLAALA
jgi:hypothetical protein